MRTRIPSTELGYLSQVPLFAACNARELREIARLGTVVAVPAGKVLIRQGEVGREFFLVLHGEAELTLGRRAVHRFGPGDYFGELALLDGQRRTGTVTAVSDMDVLVLATTEFHGLLRTSPSIAVKMLGSMADRLRRAQADFSD